MKDEFGFSDTDLDALRDLVTRNSPTILALTLAVSLVHMLFDFLAFKNDIGYWKDRRNMQGVSEFGILCVRVRTWAYVCAEFDIFFFYYVGVEGVFDLKLSDFVGAR